MSLKTLKGLFFFKSTKTKNSLFCQNMYRYHRQQSSPNRSHQQQINALLAPVPRKKVNSRRAHSSSSNTLAHSNTNSNNNSSSYFGSVVGADQEDAANENNNQKIIKYNVF